MGEFVRTEVDGAVATIRIDDPPWNVLARPVSLELAEAARRVAIDEAIRSVVVWGGERTFASGADIKAMVAYGPEDAAPDVGALEGACRELEAIAKPVIAAVTGFALGGGCEVAISCDLRFADREAKLGVPEIRLGIIPGSGGTQRLPRLIGLGRARDLVLSGRWVGAEEALAIGLVDRVVASGDVYAAALQAAHGYASGPTRAYAAAKRALAASDLPLAEGLEREREVFLPLFATRDQEEGMQAFLDKRDPEFEGR